MNVMKKDKSVKWTRFFVVRIVDNIEKLLYVYVLSVSFESEEDKWFVCLQKKQKKKTKQNPT